MDLLQDIKDWLAAEDREMGMGGEAAAYEAETYTKLLDQRETGYGTLILAEATNLSILCVFFRTRYGAFVELEGDLSADEALTIYGLGTGAY